MPFKSEAQRRFLYATNPEVAEKFSKHTKKGKKLPERVKKMEKKAGTATKTDPKKWEQAKADAKARMGGKHSARAMQLATQLYKKRGGGYSGKKPTAKNNSLKKWGKQKWKWSGGEKKKAAAVEQGGRGVYLPEDKIKRLKSSKEGKKKLRAAERKKSKANREGRQYSSHGLAAGTSLKSKDKKKEAKLKLAGHLMQLMGGNEDAMMLCKVLDSTAAQAIELKKKIKMGRKLPSWAEYKVYKAGDSIKSALSSTYTMADHMPKITIGIRTMPSMSSPLHKTAAKKKLKKIVKELHGASKKHKRQAERINALADKMKSAAAKRDPRLERAGVSGYNKVKRTPGHPTKSHIVVAKEGDRVKTIRFGQQGVKTNQTAGQRKAFKSRHAKNISKGRMSAAYWADKAKWSPSKTKDKKNQKWVKGS